MKQPTADVHVIEEMASEQADAVVVLVGEAELGLRIERVLEVVHVPYITRLPFPPPSVLGVVALRNAVLPVIDLGERLFGTQSRRDGRLVIGVVGESEEKVALLVDGVVGLAALTSRVADPPAEVMASLPEGWVAAVLAPSEDRLVPLLDLDKVLSGEQHPKESR